LNAAIQSMRWFVSSFSFVIISLTVASYCSATWLFEWVEIAIPLYCFLKVPFLYH
jgi:hypothetical protein